MTAQPIERHRPGWTFGDRLRKARRDAHLTQQQLATRLHVTAASIDAWESDRNKPRDILGRAQQIEDSLGLVRGWMLGYADDGMIAGPATGGLPHLDSNQKPAELQQTDNVVSLADYRTSRDPSRYAHLPARRALSSTPGTVHFLTVSAAS